MAKVAAAGGAPRASRLDRRKARTRQALIDAAVRLIAEGRGGRASIAEITEEADIGFGSFYNHFDNKEQLFGTASGELLEQLGQVIDQACADISDPAEVFAVSLRISGRLGWTHPDIARFLTGVILEALDASRGLAPRALRDIQAGQAAGCFTVTDAEIALSAVAGGLLGLLRLRERHQGHMDEASVDQLTEACVPVEVGVSRYRELARGQIIGDSYGVLKLLVSLDTRTLLGVHVFGTGATELIHIGQAVMGCGGTVDYLVDAVFNYPTLAEAYKVAALDAMNKMRQIARFA